MQGYIQTVLGHPDLNAPPTGIDAGADGGVEKPRSASRVVEKSLPVRPSGVSVLVSCIQSSLAKAGHVGQYLVGGLGPDKGLGFFVGNV